MNQILFFRANHGASFYWKVDKSLSVIKHNTLVEAGYHLSPVPHNLMTLAVTKVKRSEIGLPDHDKTGEVVVTADEYAKIHGIDIRTAYKDLKKRYWSLKMRPYGVMLTMTSMLLHG